ncbi:hypothetical protein HNY73_020344 [Argiope bruennichi]|uniref:Uncharacterized protein n=1 Tax=Argiope bruennichi TaxID=94029 RepID=A0A8T0E689_ARGBR|nr:hypothetical protein HNY73_020344 [Argiope bruennichi]
MATNFSEIVQPFLRIVDESPMESIWPIVNLGPKALISIYLFPNTVPESAMYSMNIATFLFYFFCTQQVQQSVWSFLVMSLCLFFMYRAPLCSPEYIDASSWYMTVIATACYQGCEFFLDVFLLVSVCFWLVQKFEKETIKCFFAMWFAFLAFFLPTIRVIATERRKYTNSSITKSAENILNVLDSNAATLGHILIMSFLSDRIIATTATMNTEVDNIFQYYISLRYTLVIGNATRNTTFVIPTS